jgi:hypothetical protein
VVSLAILLEGHNYPEASGRVAGCPTEHGQVGLPFR